MKKCNKFIFHIIQNRSGKVAQHILAWVPDPTKSIYHRPPSLNPKSLTIIGVVGYGYCYLMNTEIADEY